LETHEAGAVLDPAMLLSKNPFSAEILWSWAVLLIANSVEPEFRGDDPPTQLVV